MIERVDAQKLVSANLCHGSCDGSASRQTHREFGGSVTGKNYFVDAPGTNGIGIGSRSCSSSVCVSQTAVQIMALTSTSTGWTISTSGAMGTVGNWNFGTTTQLPAVLYRGGGCETIATNNINSNGGDTGIPDCRDLLPGQR